MNSPEELLAVLVPPDAVDWLDAGVLAVQYGVLPVHPVLRHLHAGDRHRGVGRGRVQSYETTMFSRNSDGSGFCFLKQVGLQDKYWLISGVNAELVCQTSNLF